MIFDDFYPHQAWNRTEQTRVILMVDSFRAMSKWQEYFFRLAQKFIAGPAERIQDDWMHWTD